MALLAYLKMKGQKSGDIKGSVTERGRENSIGVIAVTHSIVSPSDPQSGLPTGRRMHKPFIITKELDKSTPLLYNILCTNENIPEWTLQFWSPQLGPTSATGSEVQNYTIRLMNATIAEITFIKPNVRDQALVQIKDYEQVSFTYQKIEWTWVAGGITASDLWESRA
jgi:type VI secretion system secreted protein Hcp